MLLFDKFFDCLNVCQTVHIEAEFNIRIVQKVKIHIVRNHSRPLNCRMDLLDHNEVPEDALLDHNYEVPNPEEDNIFNDDYEPGDIHHEEDMEEEGKSE